MSANCVLDIAPCCLITSALREFLLLLNKQTNNELSTISPIRNARMEVAKAVFHLCFFFLSTAVYAANVPFNRKAAIPGIMEGVNWRSPVVAASGSYNRFHRQLTCPLGSSLCESGSLCCPGGNCCGHDSCCLDGWVCSEIGSVRGCCQIGADCSLTTITPVCTNDTFTCGDALQWCCGATETCDTSANVPTCVSSRLSTLSGSPSITSQTFLYPYTSNIDTPPVNTSDFVTVTAFPSSSSSQPSVIPIAVSKSASSASTASNNSSGLPLVWKVLIPLIASTISVSIGLKYKCGTTIYCCQCRRPEMQEEDGQDGGDESERDDEVGSKEDLGQNDRHDMENNVVSGNEAAAGR